MRLNISSKIILILSIIIISVLSIAFYLIISMESRGLFNEIKNNAVSVSKTIQESVNKVMSDIQSDRRYMQTLVEHLGEIKDVKWVEVFDREATIIAHTQKERIGGKPLEIHKSYVKEIFKTGKPIEEEDKQKGRYNRFVPVYDITQEKERIIIGVVELVMTVGPDFEQIKNNAMVISRTVQESVNKLLSDIQSDRRYMQALVEHLGEIKGVKWVEIFDREATIIAHTQKERIGGKPLEIHKSYVKEVIKAGKPIEEEDKQKGRYNRFVPVYDITQEKERIIIGVVELVMDKNLVSIKVADLRLKMILTGVALIVVMLVLILLFMRKTVILPIFKLLEMSEKVAKGNFTEQVKITSHDEFGRLGTSFNKMIESLDKKTTSIDNLNKNILERKKVEKKLESARKKAEAANLAKSEFLANMSHELRTPLNAIIGFSEILKDKSFGDINEKQEKYLNNIHSSGRHLLMIINDIIELSRTEAGKIKLERKELSLSQLINAAVTMFKLAAARKNIEIRTHIDKKLLTIHADEAKLRKVIDLLLDNALKFTPDGGMVNIQAIGAEGKVRISVIDTGIGIKPEERESIFERFKQANGTSTRKQGGTGLGLALAEKFVRMHGGDIWVESPPNKGLALEEGTGSAFSFVIPCELKG